MTQILSHTALTGADEPRQWLYILHGIYGSGRNWGTIGRRLTEERPEWGVILVDLRLHGDSTGFAAPHTVEACARDVAVLEAQLGKRAKSLLGHSFGGKVALIRASRRTPPLAQVWVVDSTLPTGDPSGTAWRIVEIVRNLPDRFESRDALAQAITHHGYAPGVGQWLAMNLERHADGFRWKLDWDGVEEMLRDYFAVDVWPIIESPPEGVDIKIVKASESNAIDESTIARLERAGADGGRIDLHRLEGGHWLNVDNPDGMLELLAGNLPSN